MIKLSLKNVSISILILFTIFTIIIFSNLFILNRESQCLQSYVEHQTLINSIRKSTRTITNVNHDVNHLAILIPFREPQNSCTYIVMHDVDLLPLNDQLSYGFPARGPFHVSSPDLHPKYHYETYVGGILLMTNEHFKLVNGFSTNYFGMGIRRFVCHHNESLSPNNNNNNCHLISDDEFYARLKEANLQIYRPENIKTNQSNTFIHIHDQNIYKRDTAKLFNQKEITRRRDRQTGLNTTKFNLLTIYNMTIENIEFRIFNVAIYCNVDRTPWCLKPSSSSSSIKFKKQQQPKNRR
ncbi:Beta-1,4-galactosyltransferase 7 [Dermatophagoides farinae]|uniref:Beta-1,4-galactosyltransferase 7 n=1 Tax=Dermatophagoides farinae TaxID=6954 RepID=A0A922LAU9_DERFA|nr:Beta-1,4-galactosyltransferase 7 [Dermatophagoides farinae]